MPRGPQSQSPLEAILGIGGENRRLPKTVGGFENVGKNGPAPSLTQPTADERYGFFMDPQLQQELADIRAYGELDAQDYQNRVAAAAAEAAQQRRAVQRDIGIQNQYRGLATGLTNEGYDELVANLEQIHPLTQQAYDTGVQSISDAYTSGVANLAIPPAENYPEQGPRYEDLAANLSALEGVGGSVDTTSFQQGITDPLQYMSQLLTASGEAGSEALATLGAGDVGAALAALPGYREEQAEEISDINLEVDAALNQLRNELGMITPSYVQDPSARNALDQQVAMREAFLDAIERGTAEEENYQGYRGSQNLAQQYGRPDLGQEFFSILSAANEQQQDPEFGSVLPVDAFIARAINSYMPGGKNTPSVNQDREILRQLYEAYIGNY